MRKFFPKHTHKRDRATFTHRKEIELYSAQTKNIDATDSLGKTALSYAVANPSLVPFGVFHLLHKGADPSHPSVRAAITKIPEADDPLSIVYELKKPIAKLEMKERAQYQERIADHFQKHDAPNLKFTWDLAAAQNGSQLSMMRVAKYLANCTDELSKLQAIFWFEKQYEKWTERENHTSIISSLMKLTTNKIPKIAFCAWMTLARIHIKQLREKTRTNTAFDPTFAEDCLHEALTHPNYSTLPPELIWIELSKMNAEFTFDTKKIIEEYLFGARLGDLFAAGQAVFFSKGDSKEAEELFYSVASKWNYFSEWKSEIKTPSLSKEPQKPDSTELKHPSGKTSREFCNEIKKDLWSIQCNMQRVDKDKINYFRTKLNAYFSSKDEKEIIREWLLFANKANITRATAAYRDLLPLYFETEPALIELRKELINQAKDLTQHKEDIASKNVYADILALERETSNKLLVKRGADRSAIIEKLIETQSDLAAKEEKSFKSHIARFTAMLTEPQVQSDQKLRDKVSHIIAVLNFREYEANRPSSDITKKGVLRPLAEQNVFFAISELDTLSKGKHLFTNQEYVGRHLFLAMKLVLNTERGLADFPQQASMIHALNGEKLSFLRGWALETITDKNREYSVMAQWYITLLDIIIPALKNSDKPIDKEMHALLGIDPDAFLLKAESIYAKNYFDAKQLAIITRRSRQDMLKGLGDKAFVDSKDKITLKFQEEEKKIVKEEEKKPEARKLTKLAELSEEDQLAAVLKLSAQEAAPVKQTLRPTALEIKSPPMDEEAIQISKDLYLAALTLLSESPQQQERQKAERLLHSWNQKTLGAKDPHYKYYLTAQWYLLLIYFILPFGSQEWRKRELDEVIKTALTDAASIAEYLPANSLDIIRPCVAEAQNNLVPQRPSLPASKTLYPALMPSAPEASVASNGMFAPDYTKIPLDESKQDNEPGSYPQLQLDG